MPFYQKTSARLTQLSLLHHSLMQSDDCPLRSLVSDQRILEILRDEGIVFGEDEDAVYTPIITLWGLLSQVFFKQEQRSCLAAVVRIAALWLTLGRKISSTNTGAYCRARRQITGEVSMLQAAMTRGRTCRSLSLTATLQMIGNLWLANAARGLDPGVRLLLLMTHQLALKVNHRPGRNEPRVNKRRPKILKLMTEPRPKPAARATA